MSKLSEKELAKKASEVFESNPNLSKVHQTTDGQCFDRQDNAINHQLTLTKKGEDVAEVSRKAKDKSDDEKSGGSELKLAELQAICTAHELPEEEWIKFKSKKEVVEYLTSKDIEIK